MNFADATQAPVTIFVGKDAVQIPRFTRRDWKAWASLADAERREEATKGLTDEDRFKFLAYYTIPPTSPREMRSRLTTYEGQEHIIRACMKKVGPEWTDERVDAFLESNSDLAVEMLAAQLASLAPSQPASKPPEGGQDQNPPQAPATGSGSDSIT